MKMCCGSKKNTVENNDLKESVKQRYAEEALKVSSGNCGASRVTGKEFDPVTANLYDQSEREQLPTKAVLASLGCGNPTALIELKPGETVLDLGSGGGIDVLLSAKRVGPSGKVYGLDMTDEMLALANENKRTAGATNVEFLKGEIEHIPLPDQSVDVIISNCVINLSADKDRVLKEAYRVLRPGGRFAVSDIVTRGEVSEKIRKSSQLWVQCAAGALDQQEYLQKLNKTGFVKESIEPTRIYKTKDVKDFLTEQDIKIDLSDTDIDGKFMSAFIRAFKPSQQ